MIDIIFIIKNINKDVGTHFLYLSIPYPVYANTVSEAILRKIEVLYNVVEYLKYLK